MTLITIAPNISISILQPARQDRLLSAIIPFAFLNLRKYRPGRGHVIADTIKDLAWNEAQVPLLLQKKTFDVSNRYIQNNFSNNNFSKHYQAKVLANKPILAQKDASNSERSGKGFKPEYKATYPDADQTDRHDYDEKPHNTVVPARRNKANYKAPFITPQLIGLLNGQTRAQSTNQVQDSHTGQILPAPAPNYFASNTRKKRPDAASSLHDGDIERRGYQNETARLINKSTGHEAGDDTREKPVYRASGGLTPLLMKNMPLLGLVKHSEDISEIPVGSGRMPNLYSEKRGPQNFSNQRNHLQSGTNSTLLIKLTQYVDRSMESVLHEVKENQTKTHLPLEKSIIDLNSKLSPEKIVNDDTMRIIIKKLQTYFHEDRLRMGIIR